MTQWPTGFPPSSHPSHAPPGSWITRARHDSRRQYLHNFGFPTNVKHGNVTWKSKYVLFIKSLHRLENDFKDRRQFLSERPVFDVVFIKESGDSATFSTAELSQEIDSNAIDNIITHFLQRNYFQTRLKLFQLLYYEAFSRVKLHLQLYNPSKAIDQH